MPRNEPGGRRTGAVPFLPQSTDTWESVMPALQDEGGSDPPGPPERFALWSAIKLARKYLKAERLFEEIDERLSRRALPPDVAQALEEARGALAARIAELAERAERARSHPEEGGEGKRENPRRPQEEERPGD